MSPSKPEIYTSTGIVIKINNLGEADRIITLITPNFGLIRGVAKSARKTVSKLGGHFDILRYVNFSIRETKSISQLSQATTIYGYKKIRTDLNLFFQTSYISEIAEKFVSRIKVIKYKNFFTLFIQNFIYYRSGALTISNLKSLLFEIIP